jgi:hypothetical protein
MRRARGRPNSKQHRGFPLNETVVVEQQGRGPKGKHHGHGQDVHGFEFAAPQAVHDELQHASDHQCRSGPVDAEKFETDQKNNERREFE